MALQLADAGSMVTHRGTIGGTPRPMSYYGGQPQGGEIMRDDLAVRTRSKSVADGRQYTRDGRPILHFGKSFSSFWAHAVANRNIRC
jgi:hypothetical protein